LEDNEEKELEDKVSSLFCFRLKKSPTHNNLFGEKYQMHTKFRFLLREFTLGDISQR